METVRNQNGAQRPAIILEAERGACALNDGSAIKAGLVKMRMLRGRCPIRNQSILKRDDWSDEQAVNGAMGPMKINENAVEWGDTP